VISFHQFSPPVLCMYFSFPLHVPRASPKAFLQPYEHSKSSYYPKFGDFYVIVLYIKEIVCKFIESKIFSYCIKQLIVNMLFM
jgi:hypothetical protein